MSTQTFSKANAAFIVAFGCIFSDTREGKKAKLYKEQGVWTVEVIN